MTKRIPISEAARMGCANGHGDGRVVFCSACGFSRFSDERQSTAKEEQR